MNKTKSIDGESATDTEIIQAAESFKRNTSKVRIEIRSANKGDAYKGGMPSVRWTRPARVWVRTYADEAKVDEKFFGFIDMRCRGPRSRAARILVEAEVYARTMADTAKTSIEWDVSYIVQ